MKVNKTKRITLPAESRHLTKIRDFVVKYGGKMGLLPKQVSEVKLAVDEACSNVIRHAYGGRGGDVTIEMTKRESSVEIRVIDKGVEFDWDSVLEPDLYRYVETRRKGGLGIWLIKKLIDQVQYNRVDGTNILTMTMYLQELPGAPAAARAGLPIRVRFALYAVALITVLIVTAYQVGSRYQVRTIRQKFLDRYQAVTQQVASASADLLLEGNELALANLAASIMKSEPPLEYVVITDVEGMILAHNETTRIFSTYNRPPGVREPGPREPVQVFTYRGAGNRVFNDFTVAITYNDSRLGKVHLGIPEDRFAEVNDLV
ncbi:MAG: ATP-binding protein, partial [Spirochaetota bacterium]